MVQAHILDGSFNFPLFLLCSCLDLCEFPMLFLVVTDTYRRGLDGYAVTDTCGVYKITSLLFISFWLGKRPYACCCKLADALIASVKTVDGLERVLPKLLLLTALDPEAALLLAFLLSKSI